MPFLTAIKRAFCTLTRQKMRAIYLLQFIKMQRSQLILVAVILFATTNDLLYKRRHQNFHLDEVNDMTRCIN